MEQIEKILPEIKLITYEDAENVMRELTMGIEFSDALYEKQFRRLTRALIDHVGGLWTGKYLAGIFTDDLQKSFDVKGTLNGILLFGDDWDNCNQSRGRRGRR